MLTRLFENKFTYQSFDFSMTSVLSKLKDPCRPTPLTNEEAPGIDSYKILNVSACPTI